MFQGKTTLERVDSIYYKFIGDLSFENEEFKITIKDGLLTDGASIPRSVWSIIGCPLTGKYVGSSLIHDGLYSCGELTRLESDQIFLDMLEHNGVGFIKRYTMYHAVRLGGQVSWDKKTEQSRKEALKYIEIIRKSDHE